MPPQSWLIKPSLFPYWVGHGLRAHVHACIPGPVHRKKNGNMEQQPQHQHLRYFLADRTARAILCLVFLKDPTTPRKKHPAKELQEM